MKLKLSPLKIIVTGASGFMGKHLIAELIKTSNQIACIDLFYDQEFTKSYSNYVQMFQGNLLDKNFINLCIQEFAPEYVFHLAGSKSRSNALHEFKTSYEINYLGALTLFEALLDCKSLKLVTILGTIEEYGRTSPPFKENMHEMPDSAYGLSKLSATKLALIFNHQFNLPIVIMRPSIAYGPAQGEDMFLPALIKSLLNGVSFKMTEGNQLRDFIYIADLIEALIKCISSKNLDGQILNIASGTSIKLKDVAVQIAEITNGIEILKIGDVPYRKLEIMNYSVDISKALTFLQWVPKTSLKEGLQQTINYYKNSISSET